MRRGLGRATARAAALTQLRWVTGVPPSNGSSSGASRTATTGSAARSTKPRGVRLPEDEGLSAGLGGFSHYGGSVTAFMKTAAEKQQQQGSSNLGGGGGGGVLPCDVVGSQAAMQAAQAEMMANAAMTGKLPSPRRPTATATTAAAARVNSMEDIARGSAPLPSPRRPAPAPASSSLPRGAKAAAAASAVPSATARPIARSPPSSPFAAAAAPAAAGEAPLTPEQLAARTREAEDYYRAVPRNELTKEEMWGRITKAANSNSNNNSDDGGGSALPADEVDYLQMEEEMRENDLTHFRIGEIGYADPSVRRDYYALWQLATALNKARWTMLEVQSQRGVKSTGAGMKLLFWKESVNAVLDKGATSVGGFTDSHPVLRPFAATVRRNPTMTKAFVRGFTSARLRVIQQPGNVQQLFDHFDKFYGYFFNSLLQVTNVRDENAEHMLLHIGRAVGLTNHCVMFWKKYARIGFTMLPADLCADSHVNLALLKNIPLASKDNAVRKVLYDVMSIAKDEMLHAQALAPSVDPRAWPIAMECFYANYYLGFLQRKDFDVSAMFADYNIDNAGFVWYRLKKRWEWERHRSIERLVAEPAPLPLIGTSISHRGSRYKMATGLRSAPTVASPRA